MSPRIDISTAIVDDDNINISPFEDAVAYDKRMKQMLLINAITKNCASSPHEILQKINHAIHDSGDGSKLEATVLSGGCANLSCKVSVDKHPELCVFAKFCFEYALWNPDRTVHYDLQRVDNEYKIMQEMSRKTPDIVVPPLACWDVKHEGQNMKLLLTGWSKGIQFCNQFIDGKVDPRIATKLAYSLAALHNIKDFEPDLNSLVKQCMANRLEFMKAVAKEASKTKTPNDRTEAYCATLGENIITKIMDANIENYNQRDCLIHSDPHVLNILVEAKPSIEDVGGFGPDGTVILCDWEMAMAGPIGKDVGSALSFPIGCMIAHGMNGRLDANVCIDKYVNTLLDTYLSQIEVDGKTVEQVVATLRNIFGWCGRFLYFVYYVRNDQEQGRLFPVYSDLSKERLRDSLGVLGLKLMRLSYDNDHVPASTSLDEVRKTFNSLLQEEVTRGLPKIELSSSPRSVIAVL
ncbi:hypothetical protein ACHAW5_002733 [Stephanodiscus triporus]|uniref:Aminoglycoside phosphotransferase domain-containing protein n=1 Tax=Stephanodiscus triporus TaxID=2934178 RepID=A0ABD3P4H6_9STRA